MKNNKIDWILEWKELIKANLNKNQVNLQFEKIKWIDFGWNKYCAKKFLSLGSLIFQERLILRVYIISGVIIICGFVLKRGRLFSVLRIFVSSSYLGSYLIQLIFF